MKTLAGCFALVFSFFCLFLITGCASSQKSLDARGSEWVARTLPELKQAMARPDSYASKIRWKEKTYPLANGDTMFVEPVFDGCEMHWQIRPSGLIVDYKAVGDTCYPKPGTPGAPESTGEQMTRPTNFW